MHYRNKTVGANKDEFFFYKPQYNKIKDKKVAKKTGKNSPFDKLSELRFR